MKKTKRFIEVDRINLPTSKYGDFQMIGFETPNQEDSHFALLKGDVLQNESIPVRIHSECITGDLFGSLRCDCGEQLENSFKIIEQYGKGIVLYLRQEGRGIGLMNKIRAYKLQEKGMDTIEANRALGFPEDMRDFTIAGELLSLLGIRSTKLITNNPEKVNQLQMSGIRVEERIPINCKPNKYNQKYLETKLSKMGHYLEIERVVT